ncbi:MAG TPA: alpha/beta hydrolase [Acidimicrobiales bacterium]
MPSIRPSLNKRRLLLLGSLGAAAGAAAAYRKMSAGRNSIEAIQDEADELASLGWGAIEASDAITVTTKDGAQLAVWDIGGNQTAHTNGSRNGAREPHDSAPTVVLPHCWGCSHAVWVPVARRLVEDGCRVVLYDQRGHGDSTRGTAPFSIEMLADDLATVLEARNVHDAVLAGHSMGGMTIMSLATHRPDVLLGRARAILLVATAAADMGIGFAQATSATALLIGSGVTSRALRSPNGRRFVRGVFGDSPIGAQMDLTRNLFADCPPATRAGFLTAMASMNLLEGIATITLPTTVIVGSRDRLTAPIRADQMISTIPGARLVTLQGRGHMLPLEDPDAVTDEIIRAVKG